MKKIIYLAGFILSGSGAFAQVHEGVITYERKMNMHRRIQDEQMKAMIPEFRTTKHQLLFSDSTSVYKAVPEDEMPDAFAGDGGGRMVIRAGGPGDNGELYKNFALGKSIESREMGAKTYIIEDSISARSWKLTGETKLIMGYTCRKAVSTEMMMMGGGIRINMNGANNAPDTANRPTPKPVPVEAWYAEGMQAPVGPESYGMLPGVILELNVDNGAIIFSAVDFKKEVEKKDIHEPKKGKKITREEYMKMQRELMGNGGSRMIRM